MQNKEKADMSTENKSEIVIFKASDEKVSI